MQNLPIFGQYKLSTLEDKRSGIVRVYRPIEDFYNFSFRPWYFLVPSTKSLFFGEMSKNVYAKIQDTNYFLADDYEPEEMMGSYMGWHWLLGTTVVLVLLVLDKKSKTKCTCLPSIYKNSKLITKLLLMTFLILLISHPPTFTISGITFYTPSYLLYQIIPVFRVLARWSTVLYLLILIINSILVRDLYNHFKNKKVLVFILIIITFVLMAVRIPTINLNEPPSEITFLKNLSNEQVKFAVYPAPNYYSVFWLLESRDYLVNPPDHIDINSGFTTKAFTKGLVTEEGIQELKKMDVDYLIVYQKRVSEVDVEFVLNHFGNSFGQEVYSDENAHIFEVK